LRLKIQIDLQLLLANYQLLQGGAVGLEGWNPKREFTGSPLR